MTSRDSVMTSRDSVMTSCDSVMTSRDSVMTSRDSVMTSRDCFYDVTGILDNLMCPLISDKITCIYWNFCRLVTQSLRPCPELLVTK